jgi:hypothetical protein
MEKEVIVDGKVINLEVPASPRRSGTPPDRRSSAVSEEPSTAAPTAASSSTTLPTNA